MAGSASLLRKIQIHAHKRTGIWYHVRRQIQESLRSTHRLARLKPGKFNVCAKRSGECARWAYSSSVGHTGLFQGLRRNADRDCALFLCPRSVRGQRKNEWTRAALHWRKKPNRKTYWSEWLETSTTRKQLAPSIRFCNQPKGKRSNAK